MKLALMSDAHDHWAHLEKAIALAHEHGCAELLFAGDLIAPPGVAVLAKFQGTVHIVWGNNEGEKPGILAQCAQTPNVRVAGDVFEGELGGVRICMNHYPRIAELAARSGEFDLCVFGHTHEYLSEKVGECWLINPGEIQGYRTGAAGFVVWDTEQRSGERVRVI